METKKEIKKSKIERIMFEKNIQRNELQESTHLSQPVLSRLIKGETVFRERTLIDVEKFLKIPRAEFLGWEGEPYVQIPKKVLKTDKPKKDKNKKEVE